MRLRRIERLDYRVFGDFTWPGELLEFADFNLIYAPNGSGKSTLARLVRMASGEVELDDIDAHLVADGLQTLTLKNELREPSTTFLSAKVFDQDFRKQALGSLEGIRWSIGTKAVAREKRLEELTKKVERYDDLIENAVDRVGRAQSSLDEFLDVRNIEVRKLHEAINPRAKYGAKRVHSDFETLRGEPTLPTALSQERLQAEGRTLGDTTDRERLSPFDWSGIQEALRAIASSASLLIERAVGPRPQERDEIAPTSWLLEGIEVLGSHPGEKCPFCRQAIPTSRVEVLKASFDASYVEFSRDLQGELKAVAAAQEELDSLRLPKSEALEPGCTESLASVAESFERAVGVAKDWLSAVEGLLQQRLVDPYTISSDKAAGPDFDFEAVALAANVVFEEHNTQLANRSGRREQARDVLATDVLQRNLEMFTGLAVELKSATTDLEEHQGKARVVEEDIVLLRDQGSDTADSAKSMTEQLGRYLGHHHLSVGSVDKSYRILRDGEPVTEVSEGERTAITLIHFLQSLNDSDVDRDSDIVMIDDPVSSLDNSAIHSAFAFLTSAIHNVDAQAVRGQVFVFTHNFLFFKLLRDWSRHLKGADKKDEKRRPTRFYELRVSGGDRRTASLAPMHPLLLRYNSEYHYLFARLLEFDPESDLLVMPTLVRRLLEAFLAFKVPELEGDLRCQIDTVLEMHPDVGNEQQVRLRALCNSGSHADRVPMLSQGLGAVDEVPGLVAAVLGLIETVDEDHCKRMRTLVADRR